MDAEWIFFATSHGKSSCDAIGGTVKRTTARESLQCPKENAIITVDTMFEFCTQKMQTIKFFKIEKESMVNVRAAQRKRFVKGKTLTGTGRFHNCIPVSKKCMIFKNTNNDINRKPINITKESSYQNLSTINFELMQKYEYYACTYDSFWWIAVVEEKDEEFNYIKMKFMHPHRPSKQVFWQKRDDYCCIPITNVLSLISVPTIISGKYYEISKKDFVKIIKCIIANQ